MTETLNYSVIRKQNNYELREYPAHLNAQVTIKDTSYQKAIYKGFSILAGYIFGRNRSSKKIDMTSPVQVSELTKIAMTKPVIVSGEGLFSVAFIMPSEYTLESLPEPTNPDVRIIQVESRTLAALRFRGYFSERKVRKAKKQLGSWVEKEGYQCKSEIVVARYNPPWMPWFLARNEVLVEIETGE
ncbi:MAG: heme-binding protein [Brevefilum sp.]|nr:heme-binding protein [Brevefilum sp.]